MLKSGWRGAVSTQARCRRLPGCKLQRKSGEKSESMKREGRGSSLVTQNLWKDGNSVSGGTPLIGAEKKP